MRFFSKLVFICNLCFIISVVMHFVQAAEKAKGKTEVALPLPFVEGSIAVLGLISILVNAVFCFIVLLLIKTQKLNRVPKWLIIFNFILLAAEIYWYFLDKGK